MSLFTKFRFANSGLNSTRKISIAPGDCNSLPGSLVFNGKYMQANAGLTPQPTIGDKIYDNATLTTLFNGDGQTYRLRETSIDGIDYIIPNTYTINSSGVITSIQTCLVVDPGAALAITVNQPVSGASVISIIGGEPNEIIEIRVSYLISNLGEIIPGSELSSISFAPPAIIANLTTENFLRIGTVTLNNAGEANINMNILPNGAIGYRFDVTILSRSSGQPMPINTNAFYIVN